ncbi:MAG: hypothetical protein KC475_05910 [Cyanobacteria bacterium HKST-UBA03]|nr:hypothetical protein [Cyanobacteria bacterium HKST-UBA03]
MSLTVRPSNPAWPGFGAIYKTTVLKRTETALEMKLGSGDPGQSPLTPAQLKADKVYFTPEPEVKDLGYGPGFLRLRPRGQATPAYLTQPGPDGTATLTTGCDRPPLEAMDEAVLRAQSAYTHQQRRGGRKRMGGVQESPTPDDRFRRGRLGDDTDSAYHGSDDRWADDMDRYGRGPTDTGLRDKTPRPLAAPRRNKNPFASVSVPTRSALSM